MAWAGIAPKLRFGDGGEAEFRKNMFSSRSLGTRRTKGKAACNGQERTKSSGHPRRAPQDGRSRRSRFSKEYVLKPKPGNQENQGKGGLQWTRKNEIERPSSARSTRW